MSGEPAVSVVVPVYNSAETLPQLATRVDAALAGTPHELVLVNDGSADGSWDAVSGLAARHEAVRGLNLMRNYGQHNALLAGIRAARAPVVVTIDDDLQNPPEEIPKLLGRLREADADVVYGTSRDEHYGLMRGLATRLGKFALRIAIGDDIAGKVTAFRAFRTDLRDAFASFDGPYVSIDALLNWGAGTYAFVEVEHHAREVGRSSYSVLRLVRHAVNVLTGFTTRPLRWASLVGLAFTAFGVVILLVVLGRYAISGSPVPGFTFLASALAIFSGVQLLTLGVIGEYLARVHSRVMSRPTYAVREEVGGG
jgi:undecaprenyl-phosphate 4-deoxy-4-formamido-L-arabinose transferase